MYEMGDEKEDGLDNLNRLEIGNNLQRIREAAGLTQKVLAEMTGLTPESISHIGNGRPFRFSKIIKIVNALETDFNAILGSNLKMQSAVMESRLANVYERLSAEGRETLLLLGEALAAKYPVNPCDKKN